MFCPLCQSESKFAFEAKGFTARDCVAGAHRFAEIAADENHVSAVYDDSYFAGGGAGYSDYLAKGKILDVGAAAGFILQGFIEEGWQGTGLEPNASIAAAGRGKFGLDIRQG